MVITALKQASIIFAIATLVGCASSSNTQSAAEHTESTVAAAGATEAPVLYTNDERLVCKRIAPTGTRISQKVCKRQRAWDALTKAAQEGGADAQRRATHSNATR